MQEFPQDRTRRSDLAGQQPHDVTRFDPEAAQQAYTQRIHIETMNASSKLASLLGFGASGEYRSYIKQLLDYIANDAIHRQNISPEHIPVLISDIQISFSRLWTAFCEEEAENRQIQEKNNQARQQIQVDNEFVGADGGVLGSYMGDPLTVKPSKSTFNRVMEALEVPTSRVNFVDQLTRVYNPAKGYVPAEQYGERRVAFSINYGMQIFELLPSYVLLLELVHTSLSVVGLPSYGFSAIAALVPQLFLSHGIASGTNSGLDVENPHSERNQLKDRRSETYRIKFMPITRLLSLVWGTVCAGILTPNQVGYEVHLQDKIFHSRSFNQEYVEAYLQKDAVNGGLFQQLADLTVQINKMIKIKDKNDKIITELTGKFPNTNVGLSEEQLQDKHKFDTAYTTNRGIFDKTSQDYAASREQSLEVQIPKLREKMAKLSVEIQQKFPQLGQKTEAISLITDVAALSLEDFVIKYAPRYAGVNEADVKRKIEDFPSNSDMIEKAIANWGDLTRNGLSSQPVIAVVVILVLGITAELMASMVSDRFIKMNASVGGSLEVQETGRQAARLVYDTIKQLMTTLELSNQADTKEKAIQHRFIEWLHLKDVELALRQAGTYGVLQLPARLAREEIQMHIHEKGINSHFHKVIGRIKSKEVLFNVDRQVGNYENIYHTLTEIYAELMDREKGVGGQHTRLTEPQKIFCHQLYEILQRHRQAVMHIDGVDVQRERETLLYQIQEITNMLEASLNGNLMRVQNGQNSHNYFT